MFVNTSQLNILLYVKHVSPWTVNEHDNFLLLMLLFFLEEGRGSKLAR